MLLEGCLAGRTPVHWQHAKVALSNRDADRADTADRHAGGCGGIVGQRSGINESGGQGDPLGGRAIAAVVLERSLPAADDDDRMVGATPVIPAKPGYGYTMAPFATVPPAAPLEPVTTLPATPLPGSTEMVVSGEPTGAPMAWPAEDEEVGEGTGAATDGPAAALQPATMRTIAGRTSSANRVLAPDRRASARSMAVRLPSRRRMRLEWRTGLAS